LTQGTRSVFAGSSDRSHTAHFVSDQTVLAI